MLRARRLLLVSLALASAVVAAAAPVAAHADLLDAEPEPNTEVETPPSELRLGFSEPLEETYTRVQLVGPNGTDHVQSFEIGDDTRQLIAKPGPLEDGVYTVEWRALSSADGHTTSGSYLLGVNTSLAGSGGSGDGDPTASDGESGTDTQVDEGGPAEAALRGAGFLGASLALGIPLFALATRGADTTETIRTRWRTTAIAGAGLASLATLGVAASLAARIELPFGTALGTAPGRNLLLRAVLFAIAALCLLAGHRWRNREAGPALVGTGAAAAAAGLLATSLGSHAAADGVGTGLSITVDWVHQAAVAFWISGVAALGIAVLSRSTARLGAQIIQRFSPLAVASVALIVVTGALASVDRLTSVGDLVGSLYGFALSAKILLLLPLVALGAYHRYRLLPQLEANPDATGISRLRRSALLELGLMVVVLSAAGVMTTTSPPTPLEDRTPYATFDKALAADRPGPYTPQVERSQLETLDESEAENVTLRLLEPGRIDELSQGDQTVWLALADETGDEPRPITDATVQIEAWMPLHGHGTQPETDPVHVNEGMYEGSTHWLMPGQWELRFDARLPAGDVLHYNLTVYVEQKADPLDQRDPIHGFSGDGVDVEVFVDPQPVTIGVQNVSVRVTPQEGVLPENADVVANLEAPSSSGGEGRSLDLERWRDDAWTREEAIFTEDGDWSVLVAFQGKDTYVQSAFQLDVQRR